MKKQHSYGIYLGLLLAVIILCALYLEQGISKNNSNPLIISTGAIESDTGSGCFSKPEIQFFMYHYIRLNDPHDNPGTQDLSVDPRDFDKQMSYIRQKADAHEITLMQGNEFLRSIETGCFPGKKIWIFTSDDGWIDTYTDLRPIAKKYNIPFFFGIIANRLDTKGFVTRKQVQEMANDPLFTISSHSMTHNDQDKMEMAREKNEICESKKQLESLINMPVMSYIYPAGRMSKNSKNLTKECGYTLAWSTGLGTKWDPNNQSRYDINRIRIHGITTLDLFKNILKEQK